VYSASGKLKEQLIQNPGQSNEGDSVIYSYDAVRRNPVPSSDAASKPVSWNFTSGGDQIIVTSNRPFIAITAIKVFDISGAVVCSFQAQNGHRENLPVLSRSKQVYLCAVETNKGRVTFKISR
jgi:hypothetical protein